MARASLQIEMARISSSQLGRLPEAAAWLGVVIA
jgi:hypothetical protein